MVPLVGRSRIADQIIPSVTHVLWAENRPCQTWPSRTTFRLATRSTVPRKVDFQAWAWPRLVGAGLGGVSLRWIAPPMRVLSS